MKQILMIASCLSVLLALSCTALGQDSMPGAFAMYGDGKSPGNNSLKAIDSILIDTSLLSVRYKACYWLYPGGSPTWHITVLHVGTSHSLFYDFASHIKNRYAYIQLMKMDSLGPGHGVGVELEELKGERAEQMAPYGDLGGIGSFFYRSVMSDYRTGVFKVAIPDIWAPSQAGFSYSLAHIYEEEVPALEWEMTGEHSEVASFDCQKAECDFRGRRWEAWFTPEIPVSEGPWKSFNEETTVYIVTGKGIEEADYRNWRMPYYPMEWL